MYEVVEAAGEWIVRKAGLEVGRYVAQSEALRAVADKLRSENRGESTVAFAMRFEERPSAGRPRAQR
jgi:hypothetical protein